jgi:hypothetical protein
MIKVSNWDQQHAAEFNFNVTLSNSCISKPSLASLACCFDVVSIDCIALRCLSEQAAATGTGSRTNASAILTTTCSLTHRAAWATKCSPRAAQ